ncbi:MAG: hypothetical protein CSB33_01340 [Desulfobacterales bacterium]|nr:MAG: hypothetical protein CSB33_01340 [Desulfobacterales bacterium]
MPLVVISRNGQPRRLSYHNNAFNATSVLRKMVWAAVHGLVLSASPRNNTGKLHICKRHNAVSAIARQDCPIPVVWNRKI